MDAGSKNRPLARGVVSRAHASGRKTLSVNFTYGGKLIREPLHLDDTPTNRKYAGRFRVELDAALAKPSFRYEEFFPNSRRLKGRAQTNAKNTVKHKLLAYIEVCERAVTLGNMSASTLDGYRKVVNTHLIPKWGKHRFSDLQTADLREWIMLMDATRKTINNILIPLRAVIDDAVTDEVIEYSPLSKLPLDRILSRTAKESKYEVVPFSAAEVRAILEHAGADRAVFQFAIFSGLRTSEYIALRWGSVGAHLRTVQISGVRVAGTDQDRTKTPAGTRTLTLMEPARVALLAQYPLTRHGEGHVFLLAGKGIHDDQPIRNHWRATCKRADIPYRNPYQTRHTFATMQLALGESPLRVASLLGHVDTQMVNRHYARWIGADTATVRAEWLKLIAELSPKNERKDA